jgi:arylsulfatase A-like enzyme
VPLFIYAPGAGKGNAKSGRPVTLMDLFPTLADLCSLPIDPAWEGHSLKPLLENPSAEWQHAALTTHGKNNHAVRTEKWRYIRYADGSEELYDHEADPQEYKNLASDLSLSGVKRELAAHLPKENAPDAEHALGKAKKKGGGKKGKKR